MKIYSIAQDPSDLKNLMLEIFKKSNTNFIKSKANHIKSLVLDNKIEDDRYIVYWDKKKESQVPYLEIQSYSEYCEMYLKGKK